MSRPRFRCFTTRSGRIIIDRKTRHWYLLADGRILDYGTTRQLPSFLTFLDAPSYSHRYAMAGEEGGD